MYKIYINDTPLILKALEEGDSLVSQSDEHLIAVYNGQAKWLFRYIDSLEKQNELSSITLLSHDLPQLFEGFSGLYRLIEAAGGLVFNPQGELLFIHRMGYWDLPKGKIDKGEDPPTAAIREVEEETGIKQPEILQELQQTYHTYRDKKDRRVLKRTYWFQMFSEQLEVYPQEEEDITEARWMLPGEFLEKKLKTYPNIIDLVSSVIDI